jgi:hypothetical protein
MPPDETTEAKTLCGNCESEIPDDAISQEVKGSVWCETCFDENGFVCERCDEANESDDSKQIGEEFWCRYCVDRKAFCCDNCGTYHSQEYEQSVSGDSWCERCANDNAFCCDVCGDLYSTDEAREAHGDLFCDVCFSENYTSCEACGDIVAREDTYGGYCEGCYEGDENEFEEIRGAKAIDGNGRGIGVEIEVSNQDSDSHYEIARERKWSSCDDGTSGVVVEYMSPILRESNYQKEIKNFCGKHLQNAGINTACGLHVHIDCADVDWRELANVFRYFYKFERWFFDLMPRSRQSNHFCQRLPNLPTPKRKSDLVNFLYGRPSVRGIKRDKYPSPNENGCVDRYFWINIHSYFYRRTLEIRLHSGTTNANKINRWIELLLVCIENGRKGEAHWKHPSELISAKTKKHFEERAVRFAGDSNTTDESSDENDFVDFLVNQSNQQ